MRETPFRLQTGFLLIAVALATALVAAEDPDVDWDGSIPTRARLQAGTEPGLLQTTAIPEHLNISEYLGPQTCVSCHQAEAEAMHGSVHYQQAGPTPNVLNIPGLAGERGPEDVGMNTYCGAHVTSRRATCGNCHVGNGQFPSTEMTQAQLENIDCLMCHQDAYKRTAAPPYEDLPATGPDGQPRLVQAPVEDANGFFYMPDENNMQISILEAARTVHMPTRASCLRCHAGAGGADGAKRGDMSSALIAPTQAIDLHMAPTGGDLACTDCHSAGGHRVRGRGLDLRPNDVAERFTCAFCHGERPHGDYLPNNAEREDLHAERVACQSCHIPTYGKGVSTETDRDWTNPFYSASACNGQGGWKPEENHASNLIPSYEWFDGRSRVYVLGESPGTNEAGEYEFGVPLGGVQSLDSKLYPMKEHRGNAARHDATGQMIPHSTGTFFRLGDFDLAVQDGMAQAGLSGDYSMVDVHTFQTINHGVVSTNDALRCAACHVDPEFQQGGPLRVDLAADYGYGLREPAATLCVTCHGQEDPETFKPMHEKHVKDLHFDCSTCHGFSRPDRGLSFPLGFDDQVVLRVDKERQGALISWTSATRAIGYDLVRGSLDDLLSSEGDFGFASETCAADDSRYLSLVDHESWSNTQATWFLIRPIFAAGPGTYEASDPGRLSERDLGIGDTCP